MGVAEEWDHWCSEFAEKWPEKLEHLDRQQKQKWGNWLYTRLPEFVPSPAVERFAAAAPADIEWLLSALPDHWKRWFVARLVSRSGVVPEALFESMLQAAADAKEPSLGAKWFAAPCEVAFGSERVVAYLVSTAESADDAQLVVGALDALYLRTRRTDAIVEQRKTFLLQAVADEKTSTYARYRLRLHLRVDDAALAHAMALFDLLTQDRCGGRDAVQFTTHRRTDANATTWRLDYCSTALWRVPVERRSACYCRGGRPHDRRARLSIREDDLGLSRRLR
jgi:hypothetical protein